MAKTLYYLLKEARPRQWIKNLTIFASIFFTGKLFDFSLLQISVIAFFTFCAGSSAIYIINDIIDIPKDRLHPFKKNRPLAAGKLSTKTGLAAAIVLIVIAIFLSLQISTSFLLILLLFVALHILYSFYLKNIILIDIITIAAGFIIRVFAGEVATGFHISIWLFLTVVSVALFLAIGKRRSELTLLTGGDGNVTAKTRSTLSHYSEKMLDVYIAMFANSAWITYAFYTFLERPPIFRSSLTNFVSDNSLLFLQDRKFLMVTIPIVIYGIMRYLELVYEKNVGESPEKVLLSDKPLIITTMILGLTLFAIIYIIGK